MAGRWLVAVTLVLAVTGAWCSSLDFNITTSWNKWTIDWPVGQEKPVQIRLSASPDGQYLELGIVAPYFNDPKAPDGPPGQPFFGLWNYEVVEAFFLNDNDQYLEVEVSPWGQHIVLMLNGERVTVRHSLPLEVTTTMDEPSGVWTGLAKIPLDYLPMNMTKFNAYAIHGSEPNRQYWSLFPADATADAPDFHALRYFKNVDFAKILPRQAQQPMSRIWSDALEGVFRYDVVTEWNGLPVSYAPVQISLQGFEAGVEMNVTAPFFNDPAPDGPSGEAFFGLWDYEVVEMFFLNDKDEYLEVELGPHGHHLLLILKGERNSIKHSLPLDYVAQRPEGQPFWTGSALIPPGYFPPNVTRMNAYSIHGTGDDRVYQALYPAPRNDPEHPQPDFHALDLFRPIDFEFQLPNNTEYSKVWTDAIAESRSTSLSPLVKNEEEVEVITTIGFFDFNNEVDYQTTLVPQLEDTTVEPETTLVPRTTLAPRTTLTPRRTLAPRTTSAPRTTVAPRTTADTRTTTVGPPRGVRPEERLPRPTVTSTGTSAHRSSTHNRGSVRWKPNPQLVNWRAPIRGQRRDDRPFVRRRPAIRPTASPVPRPHRVRGTPGRFQDRVFEDDSVQNHNFDVRFRDQGVPARRPAFQEDSFSSPPRGDQFEEGRFPPRESQPALQEDRQQFFQNQERPASRPAFQEDSFSSPPRGDQSEEGRFPPRESQPALQEDRQQFFQNQERPAARPQESRPPTDFNSPLVRPGVNVASPEVEAALETLAAATPSFPPPHPICFEPGLQPDPEMCYAFHECVIENNEWQVYSWQCTRGQVYDPVSVACVRGSCGLPRRGG